MALSHFIGNGTRSFGMKRNDEFYMHRALEQAQLARAAGEVPVGAVVVDAGGDVIGSGFNRPIAGHDPTAHAEVLALRHAAETLGNYRLDGCSLFVTLEPCLMCVGAMIHARIQRLVYAVAEPKGGMVESRANLLAQPWFNHRVEVAGGVLAVPAKRLLRDFFRERRRDDEA